jgi:hypothetical protein
MRAASDGQLEAGRTARTLGVRPEIDIPVDEDGVVVGGDSGMSVSPDSPQNLPGHRRPPEQGGTGKDPVWELVVDVLGDELVYREDPLMPGIHGFVEPSTPMTLERYEAALIRTREAWRVPWGRYGDH